VQTQPAFNILLRSWSRKTGHPANVKITDVAIRNKIMHHLRVSKQFFSLAPRIVRQGVCWEQNKVNVLLLVRIKQGYVCPFKKPAGVWGLMQGLFEKDQIPNSCNGGVFYDKGQYQSLQVSECFAMEFDDFSSETGTVKFSFPDPRRHAPPNNPLFSVPLPPPVAALQLVALSKTNEAEPFDEFEDDPNYRWHASFDTRGIADANRANAEPGVTVVLRDGILMTQTGPPLHHYSMSGSEVYHYLAFGECWKRFPIVPRLLQFTIFYDSSSPFSMTTLVADIRTSGSASILQLQNYGPRTTGSNETTEHEPSKEPDVTYGSDLEIDSACLTALIAASTIADLSSLDVLWLSAKDAAFALGRCGELAELLELYLPVLKDAHEHGTCDVAYFGVQCGEAHDAASQQCRQNGDAAGMAAESQAAILAYKKAALATIDEGVIVGRDVLAHTFNCFGLALKRAGEFNMAERAYRFALSEQNSGTGMYKCARENMGMLAEARMMQSRDRKLADEQSLAAQNKISAENATEMPNQKKKKGKRNKPKLAISDDAPKRKHKQCACCLDVKAQSELSVCAACKQVRA
jgi:hypothetical protein